MTKLRTAFILSAALLSTQACIPTQVYVGTPTKQFLSIQFYPGSEAMHDLLIINGENYFGKAQYQWGDPLGDIGFRFVDGRRIRAECIREGRDVLGQDACEIYEVFRSDFDLIPEKTQFPNPTL